MQRELKRLLHGSQAEQDLLGLVAAAGGGLSAGDLAELTGLPVYEIEENLHAVAGRTFTARASRWQPGTAPPVYVLGHEELQATASRIPRAGTLDGVPGAPARLGGGLPPAGLARRDAGIPAARLLPHAAGRHRHSPADRLRHRLGPPRPDARYHRRRHRRAHRDHRRSGSCPAPGRTRPAGSGPAERPPQLIAERNAHVPATCQSVWATIGHPERAEALARAITDPDRRAQALAGLAGCGGCGRPGPGQGAEAGRRAARAITDPDRQDASAGRAGRAARGAGDLDRAEALPGRSPTGLAGAGAGRSGTGGGGAQVTWTGPRRCPGDHRPGPAGAMLGELAWMAADVGDRERARSLARSTDVADLDRAEAAARAITEPERRAQVLAALARTAADAGDLDEPGRWPGRRRRLPGRLLDPDWRRRCWPDWREQWSRGRPGAGRGAGRASGGGCPGDHRSGRAGAGAGRDGPAAADAGDLDRAGALAGQAVAAAQAITDPRPAGGNAGRAGAGGGGYGGLAAGPES